MILQNELMYLITMSVAKKAMELGLLSEEDYSIIDTTFQEKYKPSLGTLFTDINLINQNK